MARPFFEGHFYCAFSILLPLFLHSGLCGARLMVPVAGIAIAPRKKEPRRGENL